ncbi:hypothetical protein BGZ88_008664 [Linnemannia elongata]|nr:hypothetical protein BGZ88_008664 [Linnemannia elongata]
MTLCPVQRPLSAPCSNTRQRLTPEPCLTIPLKQLDPQFGDSPNSTIRIRKSATSCLYPVVKQYESFDKLKADSGANGLTSALSGCTNNFP